MEEGIEFGCNLIQSLKEVFYACTPKVYAELTLKKLPFFQQINRVEGGESKGSA